jgi:hypothetical protein
MVLVSGCGGKLNNPPVIAIPSTPSGVPPVGLVLVPVLVGLTSLQGESTIFQAGLTTGSVAYESSQLPPETVLWQIPGAGTPVAAGSPVNFAVSSGTPTSTAPTAEPSQEPTSRVPAQAKQKAPNPTTSRPKPRPRTTTKATPYFDKAYAIAKWKDVLDDIATVDERLGDGIAVDSALSLLADSYGRVASAGTPANLDEAKYQATLITLEKFANKASNNFGFGNLLDGSAQYAVLRANTAPVLRDFNRAVGTRLKLP